MNNIVFITGAAGYIGAMLVDQFSKRDDVAKIICLDKEPKPSLLEGNSKVEYIQHNMADAGWQEKAAQYEPSVVVHAAWQIREVRGRRAEQWRWNVEGSDMVFDFAFATPSVKKIVHFSTVASYGAYSTNSLEYKFTENDALRDTDYLYAIEKKAAEEHLKAKFEAAKQKADTVDEGTNVPQVFIIRPASITGPRGRYGKVRFGLQSALSGQLKQTITHRIVSALVAVVPVTSKWCRQFIHEDDITDIVALLSFGQVPGEYEVFNACPPGPLVLGKDMADAVGKKAITVPPWLIRFVFFLAWNLSAGKIPTSKGGWKTYSYPIVVDGSKLTQHAGYQYQYDSKAAFTEKKGKYM